MVGVNFFKTHPVMNQISLRQSETWQMSGDLRGEKIACLEGKLWITQPGDPTDYILEAGENFWVTRPGKIVVQALEGGRFRHERAPLATAHCPQVTPAQA